MDATEQGAHVPHLSFISVRLRNRRQPASTDSQDVHYT